MESRFGDGPSADVSIPSSASEAVASELQELSLQPSHNLLPVRERKNVLQLKLQQRRTREELVNQGIMPPLKGSAAFHEQRRSLERARTEDYLKRKFRSRPERSELIRMHILEETSAEPSLQAKQLQLKRARLADDLNDKISQRPGPMELIHKNILPVHTSIKQAIIEAQFPKASGENSSLDEDSNDSLSPEQPFSQESPLGLGPPPSPPETLAGSSIPSPTQGPAPAPHPPPPSGFPTTMKLTNGTAASAQRISVSSQMKFQPKQNTDRSNQRHKKTKDNKPKIKKLKYHQYIPPDQKGDKEPPPHLDSSYAKILQQQQLFLQLQILSQQQQHYNYHAILPAPPKAQADQQPSSSSSSRASSSSPPQPAGAPSAAQSNQGSHSHQSSAKPVSLPPNLDEMKVAELKSELKLRSLPVSGTKNDLIERLRIYQELNGGCDTTSTPAAGGTTRPGPEGAGQSSQPAAAGTTNTSHQHEQLRCQQTGDGGSNATTPPQHLFTYSGSDSPSPVYATPSDRSPPTMSPANSSFTSDALGEMMSTPLTQLGRQPCSAAQLPVHIKKEAPCLTAAPCQFSLKAASLQKHCPVSLTAPTTTTSAPGLMTDKDKMLQEKDKQIEELTRMLRQNQRLVEVLRMQLEHRARGRQVPDPVVLVRVKQEPPDNPSVPLSFGHGAFAPPPSSTSCEMNVSVKQEATEADETLSETLRSPDTHESPQFSAQTQEVQDKILLQIKPEQRGAETKQGNQVRHQPVSLQLAQQQAIQKLLLQQQSHSQNHRQTPENQQKLQKPAQLKKKKPHKQQQKQQPLQSQHCQHLKHQQTQQLHLKQQILMKQQKLLVQQQNKQHPQTKLPEQIHIETKIHLKQQQVLMRQNQKVEQQMYLNKQSGSAASFPLDLLKSDSTPTLVTDSNGNHFLIALTNHIIDNQGTNTPERKATNPIKRLQSTPAKLPGLKTVELQRADSQSKQRTQMDFQNQQNTKAQNGGLQEPADQPQHGVPHQCLSAPPTLQPFFKDQDTAPSGKTILSHPSQTEVYSGCLDVLLSPLSPASVKTAISSPEKDTEHEDNFIDTILQTGETFKPAADPSLGHLCPNSSSSPLSPLQLLLSPPIPPSYDSPQLVPSVQTQLQTLVDTTGEKQHLSNAGTGRLEDFLESTTGKPLLGVEPGGLLTLIDDLHSQMLCTPSILDYPLSPMDTFDMAAEVQQGLDSMDWLDLTMEGDRGEETPTLGPLGPQTPSGVFSIDFLDAYDLQIH
ncbi:myocardin-related transcription factor A-like isoform X2 [Mastacembelus armatus]|uniref:myocardin-related transcription factor A-like isoform X2 n=1 Tax=Mastacembelus armatus TaxID=205130 RepID=UPI000E462EE6|nr:myocardin-related transcription factor A-like isoform X2 [Mastacembelus armatus]